MENSIILAIHQNSSNGYNVIHRWAYHLMFCLFMSIIVCVSNYHGLISSWMRKYMRNSRKSKAMVSTYAFYCVWVQFRCNFLEISMGFFKSEARIVRGSTASLFQYHPHLLWLWWKIQMNQTSTFWCGTFRYTQMFCSRVESFYSMVAEIQFSGFMLNKLCQNSAKNRSYE